MIAALAALVPAGVMSLLPLIFSGGGLATALLGFLPQARTYALIGLAMLLGLAVIYGQTEKANYQSEKAARAADNAAADQAALAQIDRDRRDRAEIDAKHQAEVAAEKQKSAARENAIHNAPPSAAGCAVPPAYRAFFDSVRREQAGTAGGGPPGSR